MNQDGAPLSGKAKRAIVPDITLNFTRQVAVTDMVFASRRLPPKWLVRELTGKIILLRNYDGARVMRLVATVAGKPHITPGLTNIGGNCG